MNYYYHGEDHDYSYWPSRLFDSQNGFSLQKNHKRIVFALVALYLSYRLSCYLFSMFASIYRWLTKSPTDEEESIKITTYQSGISRFFEGTFVAFFGLAIGAVAYYAHQKQSSQVIEYVTVVYRKFMYQVLYHSTGYDLSRSSLNPNETLIVGTLLTCLVLYTMWSMVRFLMYHYIFGFVLSLFGLFLFFYQFPITSKTAQNYSGTMFIIDRQHQFAYLVPSLIPKLLLTCTMGYYLMLLLLKSFTLFLKMSFRFLMYTLIATILLNSVTSLINEPIPNVETSTTFTPDHQF